MNLIIDGSNLLHRCFWVAEKVNQEPNLNEQDVLFIFLKSIKGLVQKFKPDAIWVAWDKRLTHDSTNFRKQLIPNTYKATRDNERTARVIINHRCIEEALITLGIKQMYPNVLEADDVIGWLAQKLSGESTIVSVDKDLLQLITDRVNVYNPIKKCLIDKNNFSDTVGVNVENYVKFKALLGDASDNIQGVEGFGTQRSRKLCVESFDSIKNTLTLDKFDIFEKNIQLIDLKQSFKREDGEEECYIQQFANQNKASSNFKQFEVLCEQYNFLSFLKDIKTWKRHFHTEQNLHNLINKLNCLA